MMKRQLIIIVFTSILLSLISCQKEVNNDVNIPENFNSLYSGIMEMVTELEKMEKSNVENVSLFANRKLGTKTIILNKEAFDLVFKRSKEYSIDDSLYNHCSEFCYNTRDINFELKKWFNGKSKTFEKGLYDELCTYGEIVQGNQFSHSKFLNFYSKNGILYKLLIEKCYNPLGYRSFEEKTIIMLTKYKYNPKEKVLSLEEKKVFAILPEILLNYYGRNTISSLTANQIMQSESYTQDIQGGFNAKLLSKQDFVLIQEILMDKLNYLNN